MAVWACAGAVAYISVLLRVDHSLRLDGQLFFAALMLLLMALCVGEQFLYNKRFKPIHLSREGVWLGEPAQPGGGDRPVPAGGNTQTRYVCVGMVRSPLHPPHPC